MECVYCFAYWDFLCVFVCVFNFGPVCGCSLFGPWVQGVPVASWQPLIQPG